MSRDALNNLINLMPRLRWITLINVLWFTLFFNIERLDLGSVNTINMSNPTYAIVILIGFIILGLPNVGGQRFLTASLLIMPLYFALTLLLVSEPGSRPFYIWIAEIAGILISLFLLRLFNLSILNLEVSLDSFVSDPARTQVGTLETLSMRVQQELDRSQHFEYPFTVLHVQIQDIGIDEQTNGVDDSITRINKYVNEPIKRRFLQVQLAHFISLISYKSDIVVEYEDNVLVFMPETDKESAMRFVNQLHQFMTANMKVILRAGLASFPDDGLSYNQLAQTARARSVPYFPNSKIPQTARHGDVLVGIEKRMEIEEKASWVNKMTFQSPSSRLLYSPVKRAMDILPILLLSPLLVPVCVVVGLAVFLETGRPIFYMQDRTGFGGKRFKMYKFRSMEVDAKAKPAEIQYTADGQEIRVFPKKDNNDKRVTKVGKFIRKTSLDELPQLLNVLTGEMSLIGPRPTTWEVEMYTLYQTERLAVKPGITGLWQVCARDAQNLDERLIWDIKYVEKMSLWLDIQILWRTFLQVFERGGV